MTLIHWVNQGGARENSPYGLYMRVFGNCSLHIDLGGMLELGSREFLVGALWSLWEKKSVGYSP